MLLEQDVSDLKKMIEGSISQAPGALCGFFAPNGYGRLAIEILERHGIRVDVNIHHGGVTYDS